METLTNFIQNISSWWSYGINFTVFLIAAIFAIFTSSKLKKIKKIKKRLLKENTNILEAFKQHSVIHEKLINARTKLDASHGSIFLFHNGGTFMDGSSFKKFSVSHESCDENTQYEAYKLQSIPISLFGDLFGFLEKNDIMVVEKKKLQIGSFRRMLKTRGTENFSILPLKRKELLIGFILFEWNYSILDKLNEHKKCAICEEKECSDECECMTLNKIEDILTTIKDAIENEIFTDNVYGKIMKEMS